MKKERHEAVSFANKLDSDIPEINLFISILEQAVHDALVVQNHKYDYERHREEAWRYIFSKRQDDTSFIGICETLHICPNKIKGIILEQAMDSLTLAVCQCQHQGLCDVCLLKQLLSKYK